ncbi:hypothetical protein CYMTET_47755 [Cymbomonas tetramitiformis]|uniref:Secreted protein n=1 Tax=Cymbomonas tetramitiformis TaxID=36881 RepID=A0AAE0BTN7_9CHLO|nr:hypothetical protein CYMTET_47755 [Cymbomonas tetramitiformis]|eukprot:gene369-695_t
MINAGVRLLILISAICATDAQNSNSKTQIRIRKQLRATQHEIAALAEKAKRTSDIIDELLDAPHDRLGDHEEAPDDGNTSERPIKIDAVSDGADASTEPSADTVSQSVTPGTLPSEEPQEGENAPEKQASEPGEGDARTDVAQEHVES